MTSYLPPTWRFRLVATRSKGCIQQEAMLEGNTNIYSAPHRFLVILWEGPDFNNAESGTISRR